MRMLGTGLVAAAAVLLLPAVICGVAREKREPPAVPVQTAEAPVVQERRVAEIIVHQNQQSPAGDAAESLTVTIGGEPKELTLEEYLVGVLLGEMPASYPLEALKAQAVAARTYTLRRLEGGGILSDDPSVCQAYVAPDTAEPAAVDKARQAVQETDGQVLCYDGALIAATYFSCSGGRTESAQAVWGGEVPYLVSVDSPGEEDSASFESTVTLSLEEFLDILDIDSYGISDVTYTDGGGVETMIIGGKPFTGVELRKKLGLRSTRFTMEVTAQEVIFSVQGFGHRVGLSQNGARVMAENGSSYAEILRWYYTGVELVKWL